MALTDYSTTPANNSDAPPNGAPEGMLAASVNDTMRQIMADIKDGVALTIDTVALLRAVDVTKVSDGNRATVSESAANGDALGGSFKYVLASSASDDGFLVVAPTAGSGRWLRDNNAVQVGNGIKGNSQTNVGVQIERDITNNGSSSHGFNCADYFADDTEALNPFGADIQVGDGNQTTEVFDHVHDFQCTDQIDMGGATLSVHQGLVVQTSLLSGTVSRFTQVNIVDPQGVRDTAGFGVPGFETNGSAVVDNITGLAIAIVPSHATNAKSLDITAPFTDGGSLTTTGGGDVDIAAQVRITEARTTTSLSTGALLVDAGGAAISGNIFNSDEHSVVGTAPIFRGRDAALTTKFFVQHVGNNLSVMNSSAGDTNFGLSGANVLTLKSDRLIPTVDSTLNLGDTTHKWLEVFADNATINTSDERLKKNIDPVDDAVLDAWGEVNQVLYRWKKDDTLIQAGYIAQHIQKAFEKHGLNAFDYNLIREDALEETITKTRKATRTKMETVEIETEVFEDIDGRCVRKIVIEKSEQPVTKQRNVENEDGSPYLVDGNPLVKDRKITEEYDEEYTEVIKTDETRMSLRYSHCFAIETAYLRRKIERLENA